MVLREKDPAGASTPSLELGNYLPYRLAAASSWTSRLIARIYEDRFSLSITQWRILALLGSDGPMTQTQITQHATMDKIAAHRAAASLVRRRYIEVSDAPDRRFKLLQLSRSGRTVYDEVVPLALTLQKKIFERAGIQDMQAFQQSLENIERASQSLFQELVRTSSMEDER